MKTIHKFTLEVTDNQFVKMPKGAKVLAVQMQNDIPCIWAEVNTDNEIVSRCFEIFGTGNPIHEDMGVQREYIGTFQQRTFVWHLYEYTGI